MGRCLVRSTPSKYLFFRAKHLFVAAKVCLGCGMTWINARITVPEAARTWHPAPAALAFLSYTWGHRPSGKRRSFRSPAWRALTSKPTMSRLSEVAFHEAGHALAAVRGFRTAKWLPFPPPPLPVTCIEIADSPAGLSGSCTALNIYSTRWSDKRVSERFRDLMERQIAIHLAGGLAEAIHRGERRKEEVLRFATLHCGTDIDLQRAAPVLADLRRVAGDGEQRLAERALVSLLTHWPAVDALAQALIVDRRIEGERVERIIDHSIGSALRDRSERPAKPRNPPRP